MRRLDRQTQIVEILATEFAADEGRRDRVQRKDMGFNELADVNADRLPQCGRGCKPHPPRFFKQQTVLGRMAMQPRKALCAHQFFLAREMGGEFGMKAGVQGRQVRFRRACRQADERLKQRMVFIHQSNAEWMCRPQRGRGRVQLSIVNHAAAGHGR